MKITLEVSQNNECTFIPWWVIVDPLRNMKIDVHVAAAQIEGPFFSREEAEAELEATRYNYSKRACVYCMSGCRTRQYKEAWLKYADRQLSRKVFWFKILPYKLWLWLRK